MPARNGSAYLDGLRAQEREIWLDGERVRTSPRIPALRQRRRGDRRAVRHAVRPKAARRDDLCPAGRRRSRRPVVHHPAHARGPGTAARHDAELGALHLRHDGALARLHERHLRRLGRRRGLLRAPGGRNSATTCAATIGYIRDNDLTLTHSLINLQRSRTVSGMFNLQEGTALQVIKETRRGHCRARRARAGDAGAVLRRDRGLFAARRTAHATGTARSS